MPTLESVAAGDRCGHLRWRGGSGCRCGAIRRDWPAATAGAA